MIEDDVKKLLVHIGENPERGGLLETPARFLKAWKQKTSGYGEDPSIHIKAFEDGSEHYDEMIVISGIEIESSCEHHLERIWGVAHIGYIPNGKVLGLSKFYRIVNTFARRLQVQERLTVQVADCIMKELEPLGFGIVIEARHACMEVRGIQKRGQVTTTSSLKGKFLESEVRNEFLNLIQTGGII